MFFTWVAKFGRFVLIVLITSFIACKVTSVLLVAKSKYCEVKADEDSTECKKNAKEECDEKAKKQGKENDKHFFMPHALSLITGSGLLVDSYTHPILLSLYYNVLTPPPLLLAA